MNQQTTDTARKAIRFFQGQLGPNRITGGPLPGNAGLMVGIKPPPEQAEAATTSHTSEQNGHGSNGAGGAASTLDALLVVANRDEEDPPLIEALRDGECIGPAGDVVGERTRHAILSWREDQIDEDGSMSEGYVVSVAATLIQSPPSAGDLSAEDDHQRPADRQVDNGDSATSAVVAEGTDKTASGQDEAGSATHEESERDPALDRPSEPQSPPEQDHSSGQSSEGRYIDQDKHSRAEVSVAQQPTDPGSDSSQPDATGTEQQSVQDDPEPQDEVVAEPVTDAKSEAHVSASEPSQEERANELNAGPQRAEEPEASGQPSDEPEQAHPGEDGYLPEPETADEQPPDAPETEYEVDAPALDDPADEEAIYGSAHEDAPGDEPEGDATPASEQDTRELETPVQRRAHHEQADAARHEPDGQDTAEEFRTEQYEQTAKPATVGESADSEGGGPHTSPYAKPGTNDGLNEAHSDDYRGQQSQTTGTTASSTTSEPSDRSVTDEGNVPNSSASEMQASTQPDSPSADSQTPTEAARDEKALYPAGQAPEDYQHSDSPENADAQDGARQIATADQHADPVQTEDLEDPHSGWLEGLVSGTTPTPEQRAYYIGKQRASKLTARLTFKKAPEPPPRLASVDPIPEQAIERIASSPKGPGIVMPMTSKGGTGKTTVAVELAFMLGMVAGAYGNNVGGRTGRVLLADMNINNPDLAERVDVDGAGRMGLKDLLNGEHLSRVVNRTALPNVDALFLLGKEDYDKADLPAIFSDERGMEAIISAVAGDSGYDFVVVDTSNTFPGEAYNPASYSLTMWAVAADARYLILQPEIAGFVNAARFAARMGHVIGDETMTVPLLNRFPVSRVYEEAPITAKMAANRRDAIKAIKRLQEADGYPVTAAMDARGDPLGAPLYLPDYPEEVQGFGAEGRPLCMYSQTFAAAYHRIAMDAVRRIYDNRKPQ